MRPDIAGASPEDVSLSVHTQVVTTSLGGLEPCSSHKRFLRQGNGRAREAGRGKILGGRPGFARPWLESVRLGSPREQARSSHAA